MTGTRTTAVRWARKLDRWLRQGRVESHRPPVDLPTAEVPHVDLTATAGHAPGHRRLGPPPKVRMPRRAVLRKSHDQPWVPTGGLTDRLRRSERRG
jgi:hypothetical protein